MDAGMLSKILYIDLNRRRHWINERPELFEESLGGAGVGIRLLSEECPPGADPLGPENPIIFSVGYFDGVFLRRQDKHADSNARGIEAENESWAES